jgi:hypothetical protein
MSEVVNSFGITFEKMDKVVLDKNSFNNPPKIIPEFSQKRFDKYIRQVFILENGNIVLDQQGLVYRFKDLKDFIIYERAINKVISDSVSSSYILDIDSFVGSFENFKKSLDFTV